MGEDKPEILDALAAPVTGRRLKRKYQVFVSSTYRDLSEERETVVWTILECRQIPVGMESFSATDDRGWKTIQRTIDDTDYYVLLLAGTYGSVDPSTGMSWTEREYEYAVSKGIPVLAFIREPSAITADKIEQDPDKKKKLDALIERVSGAHMRVYWKTADDLSKSVATALFKQIEDDEGYGVQRLGWIRGDMLPPPEVMNEFARLSKENAHLRLQLSSLKTPERVAKLELVDDDDGEFPAEMDRELKSHSIETTNRHISVYLKEYLSELSRVVWIGPRLFNCGTAQAEGVVVDYRVLGADALIFRHEKPLPPGEEPEDDAPDDPWQTDSSRPVYIDRISDDRVRQRVRQIPPGADEELIPIGIVVSENSLVDGCPVVVEYRIAEAGGAQAVGRILIKAWRGPGVVCYRSWDAVP